MQVLREAHSWPQVPGCSGTGISKPGKHPRTPSFFSTPLRKGTVQRHPSHLELTSKLPQTELKQRYAQKKENPELSSFPEDILGWTHQCAAVHPTQDKGMTHQHGP